MQERFELESGRCSELVFDPERRIVTKRIIHLPDFAWGINKIPTVDDYSCLVGESINFLFYPCWGLGSMIPPCQLRIIADPHYSSGCSCFIEMDWIEGCPLCFMTKPAPAVFSQLADFLGKCVFMAQKGKENRRMVVPDLLGGVRHPHSEFRNFVVESATGCLYFTDVYPLAKIEGRYRGRYRKALAKAALKTENQEVIQASQRLIQAL